MDRLIDTATETGRDDETNEPAFVPDDAWIDVFQKQLTAELVDQLRSYARMRALAVGYAGRKVDDYYAHELVQDAIGDTWTGVLRWDPAGWTLKHHLVRAIQGRADKDRKHAKRHRHDAIGDTAPASYAAECEASSLVADDEHAARRLYSIETMTILRAKAVEDRCVTRILDAYDAGAQSKEDVLAHTKMKARAYHNAHIRLRRLVRQLTDRSFAPRVRA